MAFTASCIVRKSRRRCSRVSASRRRADLVRARGARGRAGEGPRGWRLEAEKTAAADCESVPGELTSEIGIADVSTSMPVSPPSSSSTPNDNFPFAACFFRFFTGPDVNVLCFDHQLLILLAHLTNLSKIPHNCGTQCYSKLTHRLESHLLLKQQ